MVPKKGLEPPRLSALDPKSSVSTNSTTSAKFRVSSLMDIENRIELSVLNPEFIRAHGILVKTAISGHGYNLNEVPEKTFLTRKANIINIEIKVWPMMAVIRAPGKPFSEGLLP